MSVLIKGMKMPKSCYDCVLNHSFFHDMNCSNLEGMSGFGCALSPEEYATGVIRLILDAAPTVIPADNEVWNKRAEEKKC